MDRQQAIESINEAFTFFKEEHLLDEAKNAHRMLSGFGLIEHPKNYPMCRVRLNGGPHHDEIHTVDWNQYEIHIFNKTGKSRYKISRHSFLDMRSGVFYDNK